MPTVIEVTDEITVDLVGKGPTTISSGFLVSTDRPGLFDYRDTEPELSDDSTADAFDPNKHSVDDVLSYLSGVEDTGEWDRIAELETNGKARKTLLAVFEGK